MRTIKFTIPGRLPGKQRARHRHGGNVYTPAETQSAEAMVKWYGALALKDAGGDMLDGPLKASIFIWRLAPPSWSAKKKSRTLHVTGKPDCDNQIKTLLDALNGVLYRDDSQFAEVSMARKYSVIGSERVEVVIEELFQL